jgi:plastocyanin
MKSLKKWLGTIVLASGALFVAPPSSWAEDEYDADVFEIIIKDLDFLYEETSLTEQVVVLPTGMHVSWMNVDPLITSSGLEGIMPHGVKLTDEEGEVIEQSQLLFQDTTTFGHQFAKPGVYDYQCIVHPFMKGKFLVFDVQPASLTAEHHMVGK